MRKTVALLFLSIAAFLGALFMLRGQIRDTYARWQRGPVPPAVSRSVAQQAATAQEINANIPAAAATTTPAPVSANANAAAEPTLLPAAAMHPSFNLQVLFIPQAPKQIWDATHEDACEEASMLMLQAYQNDVTSMTTSDMDQRLLAIIAYEKTTFGGAAWKSTDAQRTAAIMRDFLGLKNVRVVPITSIDDVKNEIAQGRPVMLPTSGKLLKNPNFKNGGPDYHMIVAKGYTTTTIIANDPGTRLGADYIYGSDTLWNAIHDWNGGDVLNGSKVMIVVE